MPTPPVQRRNPSISVRRVQSERKYLSPWGCVAPCPIWKPQFEHARKTAIIPPLGTSFIGTAVGTHPYMLGTSQGVLGCHVLRGAPILHPHMSTHPLVLVAPPLFLGGFSSPPRNEGNSKAKEGELLAQERIATFLTEETQPHKPRSLLSYPDSHLYESLISQLSDLNAEDISLEYSKIDSDYLHYFSPNSTIRRPNKSPTDTSSSGLSKASIGESIKRGQCKEIPHFSDKVNEEEKNHVEKVQYSENAIPSHLRKISFIEIQNKILENNSQMHLTKIPKGRSTPEMFRDTKDFHKKDGRIISQKDKNGNLISTISKPITKLKDVNKSQKGNNILLLPTPTVVSVVHVNKENGIDEASFRESTCYKCGGNPQRSHSSSSDVSELYERSRLSDPQKQKIATVQNSKVYYNDRIWKDTVNVPRTIELLESEPSSRQSSNISLTKEISIKAALPTSLPSLECRSYGSLSSKDSTLDPLKPTSLENTKRIEPLVPKVITENLKKNSRIKDVKDGNYILPLTINFDSEESSSDGDDPHHIFSTYDQHESDSESMYSSILEFYSIATTRPDSFVYVYKSPSKSDRSNSTSRTSSMSLRFNVNMRKGSKEKQANGSSGLGSSGLGSSGSDDSFEDVSIPFPSSSIGSSSNRTNLDISLGLSSKSSVTFLEPSFCSTKYTPTPRCSRLSFDYSCSWTDLNNLVKKSSPCELFQQGGDSNFNSPPEKFLNQKRSYNKFSSASYSKKTICS